VFGTPFSDGPDDGIHDIRLPATVRAYDAGDAFRKIEIETIDKGFEANRLKGLDLHAYPSKKP
jgi:hypothetical protein